MEGRLRAVVAVDVGVQGIEPLLIFAQLYGCGGGGGLAADAELRYQGLDAGHALVDLRMRFQDSVPYSGKEGSKRVKISDETP